MVNLSGIFSKFRSRKILVIGDLMLDKYTTGNIQRISPEAPVSILHVSSDYSHPGGAGNVVLNVLALKADVTLSGRVGDDPEGRLLKNYLRKKRANVDDLYVQKDYPTPLKNRLMASSQQVIRVDREKICPLSRELEAYFIKKIPSLIEDKEVIVISDYGKGFLTNNLLAKIIQYGKEAKIPLIIDPKGNDFTKYRNAYLIKPNLSEAYAAASLSRKDSLDKVAEILFKKTKAEKLLITRSEEGMTFYEKDGRKKDFPVLSKEVVDVTGAGDTVLATLAVCLANRFDWDVSIRLANLAAGIAIEHVGCVSVTFSDLSRRLLELDVDNKIFEESHLFALKEVLEGNKFVILGVDSKKGMTNKIFRSISDLKGVTHPKAKLLIYVRDKDPNSDFVALLSSLNLVDFIVLQQKSLKSLCVQIKPDKIYEMSERELVVACSEKKFL